MDRLVYFLALVALPTCVQQLYALDIGESVTANLSVIGETFTNLEDEYPMYLHAVLKTRHATCAYLKLNLTRDGIDSLSQTCVTYTGVSNTSSLCVKKLDERRYTMTGSFCERDIHVTITPKLPLNNHTDERQDLSHILSAESQCKLNSTARGFNKAIAKTRENDRSDYVGTGIFQGSTAIRQKRSPIVYTIELLMVVDFAAYNWWLSLQRRGPGRASTTMDAIRQYYSYIFSGINDRFQSIAKLPYSIDVAFVDIIVAKSKKEAQWTETSLLEDDPGSTRVMVNSSEALDKFQKWLDETPDLPRYDHAVLFTGTNLSYAGSPGNTGLAFAASMCRNISNSSIVEDAFDFRTVLFAVQQISRSLGASDDMDNNDCLEFFNYVMAPKLKLPIKSFTSNRWKFSSCSEVYFSEYIDELNAQSMNCLSESDVVVKIPASVTAIVQSLPGKVYQAKQQCQHRFGQRSDVCREEIYKYKDICGGLLCIIPGMDGCGYILPADGTACGNKKYCSNGKCSNFEDAEVRSDSCVFGNQPKMKCNRRVFRKTFLCYEDKMKNKCCQSCDRVRIKAIPNCEYGDRSEGCSLRGCTRNDNTYITKTCCLTCADGPTPFAPPLDFDFSTSPTTVSSTSTGILSTTITPTESESTLGSTSIAEASATTGTVEVTESTKSHSSTPVIITIGESDVTVTDNGYPSTSKLFPIVTTSKREAQTQPQSSLGLSSTDYSDLTTTDPFGSTYDPYFYTGTSGFDSYTYFTSSDSFMNGQTQSTSALNNYGVKRMSTTTPTITTTAPTTIPPTTPTIAAGSKCTGSKGEAPPSTKGPPYSTYRPYREDALTSVDRLFFHNLAVLMRQGQSQMKADMHQGLKRLYRYVSHGIRRFQDSDLEPLSFVDPLPPRSESPSSDDDDLNRTLHPLWRHQYVDVMRRLKTSVKRFRYKVLAFVKRFLRDH